jgi:hypothetical protein
MWRTMLIFFVGLTLSSRGAAPTKANAAFIKQQLAAEIAGLLKDLDAADIQLQSLTQDNQQIKLALNDMEAWGLLQQQEKDRYYTQSIDALSEISAVRGALDAERAGQEKLLNNYRKLKSIMGYLFGTLLALIYLKFSSTFLSIASLAGGPQMKLLSYLAPAACFGAGYIAVYLYF